MEHQHKYTAGAIRGKQTFRYCSECSHMLWCYGTNKPEVRIDEDYEYYKEMAIRHGIR